MRVFDADAAEVEKIGTKEAKKDFFSMPIKTIQISIMTVAGWPQTKL